MPSVLEEPQAQNERLNGWGVSLAAVRNWILKSGLAIFDQGITSGSSLMLNMLLARWLAPASYGAFAVSFAVFLFLSGLHNALVLEPMSVLGPANYSYRLGAYFPSLLKIHIWLTGALAGLFAVCAGAWLLISPGRPLAQAFLGSALAMPLILFMWMQRRLQYLLGRPSRAVALSLIYFVLAAGGIAVAHHAGWDNPFAAFAVMGLASLAAAGLLVLAPCTAQARQATESTCVACDVLKENWHYGRWLVAVTFLTAAAGNVQTFLVAGLLGLKAAGTLRAVQLPMLAMTQAVTAISVLVLPIFSYEFGRRNVQGLRRKALLTAAGLTAVAVGYEVILILIPGQIERLLYGGKFAAYVWLIPVLGLAPVFIAFTTGYSLILRAIQRPQHYLIVGAATALVGVISGVWFTQLWGIAGASISVVLATASSAGATVYLYRIWCPQQTPEIDRVLA